MAAALDKELVRELASNLIRRTIGLVGPDAVRVILDRTFPGDDVVLDNKGQVAIASRGLENTVSLLNRTLLLYLTAQFGRDSAEVQVVGALEDLEKIGISDEKVRDLLTLIPDPFLEKKKVELIPKIELEKRYLLLKKQGEEEKFRFETFFEKISSAIWSVDTNLRITFAAGYGFERVGMPPAKTVGMDIFEFFGSKDPNHPPISAHLRAMKGETVLYEITYHGLTFSSRVEPLKNSLGEIVGVIGVGLEVTELKKKEQELEVSEQRFNSFLSNSPVLSWIKEQKSQRYVFVNETWSKYFCFTRGDTLEHTVYDVFPKSLADKFVALDKKVISSGVPSVNQEVIRLKNRPEQHFLMFRFLVKGSAGKEYVGGNAIDISDRVKTEAELTRSQEEYHNLFDHVRDAAVVLDPRTLKILDINHLGEGFFGLSKDELIGQDILNLQPENQRGNGLKAFFAKAAKTALKESVSAEFTGANAVVPVNISFSSIVFSGQPAWLGVIKDESERRAAELRLREINELRSTFINIISHQLRTPLNSVRWNLEVILSGELGKMPKKQEEFLRVTHAADVEMIERVNDLLTAMDIEEGRIQIERQMVAIESIWGQVINDWRKDCEVNGLVCRIDRPAEPLPTLFVDPDRIRDVIRQLVDNAVKYTPKGGSITISMRPTNGSLRFEVDDSGIGIPNAEKAKIMSRFFRASNAVSLQPDATGVGLFIAKRIVELHGGKIGFESEEGKGSKFWIELPIS